MSTDLPLPAPTPGLFQKSVCGNPARAAGLLQTFFWHWPGVGAGRGRSVDMGHLVVMAAMR